VVVSPPTFNQERSWQTAGLGPVAPGNPDDREVIEKGLLAAMGSDPAASVSRPKGKTKATNAREPTSVSTEHGSWFKRGRERNLIRERTHTGAYGGAHAWAQKVIDRKSSELKTQNNPCFVKDRRNFCAGNSFAIRRVPINSSA